MEEIVTVGGKQYKLTTDRPLTTLERQQTISQIQKQTGCSSCGPKTMSAGFGDIYSMGNCPVGAKAEGEIVTLTAGPTGGIGPYYVNFWRRSGPVAYTHLGSVQTIAVEGGSVSTSFTIYDTDYVNAVGDTVAYAPDCDTAGQIMEGTTASVLVSGSIRVATTTFDSCPTGPKTCTEYCDVALTCVAPTCNFVVT